MSKPNSGLFWGTLGTKLLRLIPGEEGTVNGGNSTLLGKNLLSEMNVSRKEKWTGYQAQHIIPSALKDHPVLKKIGIDLDNATNGIFLRIPNKNSSSTLSRHKGFHSIYNTFVKKKLDSMNINNSSNSLQKDVKLLQCTLKAMLQNGVVIYPNQGGSIERLEKEYKRFYKKIIKGGK